MRLKISDKPISSFFKILGYSTFLLCVLTGCCALLTIIGEQDKDISHLPEFKDLYCHTYRLKIDVFISKFSDTRQDVLSLDPPGVCSLFPKTIQGYYEKSDKYPHIKGIISAGTEFRVVQVVDTYYPSGNVFSDLYLKLDGYDFGKSKIGGGSLYNFVGENYNTFDSRFVELVE